MDASELLKSWPGLSALTADALLRNPAWRLALDLDGVEATLTCPAEAAADEIPLAIELDGEPLTLGLSDSERHGDLHLLWTRRAGLPPPVVLALVEKECGDVFKAVEAASRRLLSVRGLAEAESAAAPRRAYRLALEGTSAAFSLTRLPTLEAELGRLCNLDCAHPAVRGLERPVAAEYALFPAGAFDPADLAPGDRLTLPDAAEARWRVESAPDDAFHIVSSEPVSLAFAQFADDALPPVPEPGRLILLNGDAALAEGEIVRLGDARAFLVRSRIR